MSYENIPSERPEALRIAVIGTGWIGAFHARSLADHIPGAQLYAVADPAEGRAAALAAEVGCPRATQRIEDVFEDEQVDAVVIGAPSAFHAQLITQAARAGKHVFCEKPTAHAVKDLDAALEEVERAQVVFQVGFNRRFSADFAYAGEQVRAGAIGRVQLLRSVTRDPAVAGGLPNAGAIRSHVIFTETLIHDFDALNWLNPGAQAVEVHTVAAALVAPEHKDSGLLDTAVVTVRYDNGAIAIAEASFSASYGYDVRGEVFGSGGMLQAGGPAHQSAILFDAQGAQAETSRLNIDLFADAYRKQLDVFVLKVRGTRQGTAHAALEVPGGSDARAALRIALAALESHESGLPVRLDAASRLAVAG
ncbi:myo-inositol 2-dehydrogenase/D-chiro-inositol 1-dehydrogenase [Arthrobacter sp. AG1021]|uniref:Gfo/Idh/MocA family oxidoreductase n=1 Tax=Arthrobacter sp. AG1021 TaxID=2183908 RepID=UPI000EB3886A|nr:Gfo/Idh/MocA family oxidoreductase [Arthrobacter sp. AG1021]RKS16806.1 myo-inositol 2-dehydrogenase/D-chiro-inositol 1-dehydrogenase [Arthrobacter sp. AG1021]